MISRIKTRNTAGSRAHVVQRSEDVHGKKTGRKRSRFTTPALPASTHQINKDIHSDGSFGANGADVEIRSGQTSRKDRSIATTTTHCAPPVEKRSKTSSVYSSQCRSRSRAVRSFGGAKTDRAVSTSVPLQQEESNQINPTGTMFFDGALNRPSLSLAQTIGAANSTDAASQPQTSDTQKANNQQELFDGIIELLTKDISYPNRFHSTLHPICKSPQIHVVQDCSNGKPINSTFGVVVILKVLYADSNRLISTCSLCPHAPSLRSYIKSDFSATNSPAFDSRFMMGCKHTHHVIGSVFGQVVVDDDTSPEAIERCILLAMTDSISLSEGWFDIPEELPINGTFAVYISEHWETQVLKVYFKANYKVYLNRQKEVRYQCLRCARSQSKTCEHCHISGRDYGGPIQEERPITTRSIRVLDDLVSKQKYPLDLADDQPLSKIIRARAIKGGMWYVENYPDKKLQPAITVCTICHSKNLSITRATRKSSTLASIYTPTLFLEDFAVYNKICLDCESTFEFDGRNVGLVNFRNTDIFPGIPVKVLITVEVLMDLLESKASNGTPTYAWWTNKIEWSLRCHAYDEEFGEDYDYEHIYQLKMKFRDRYMAKAGRVNQTLIEFCRIIDLGPKLFTCCKNPDVICVDGVVISVEMQRIVAMRLSQPWLLGPGKAKRATTREDRHIWNGDKIERQYLLAYAKTGISADEFDELLDMAASSPVLRSALSEFTIVENDKYKCVSELYYFFRSLGKDVMPATQFLPSVTWDAVTRFLNDADEDSTLGKILELNAPVMSHLYFYGLRFLNQPDSMEVIKGLFRVMLKTAKESYPDEEHEAVVPLGELPEHIQETLASYESPYQECLKTGVYFPQWRYHSAIYKVKIAYERSCMKYAKKNGRLGSGCLLYWCARHRICLGWEMLLEGESPKQVYHTLCSRFPVMPKIIIYDNGCNLFEYFYNRSPRLGLRTLFLSDGFHFCHHINCSHTFDCKKYTRLLNGISSVTHEQKNSILARLKLTAPGMRYDSFVLLMSCVLGMFFD